MEGLGAKLLREIEEESLDDVSPSLDFNNYYLLELFPMSFIFVFPKFLPSLIDKYPHSPPLNQSYSPNLTYLKTESQN